MGKQSQCGAVQFGWRQRVGWNGFVQWLLALTLIAPSLLVGPSASTVSVAHAMAQPETTAVGATRAERIDPRITQVAHQAPAQLLRVIVQKLNQDQGVEQLVADLGGNIFSDLPIINAFAAEMSADAAYQLAQSPTVRWISIDAEVKSSLQEMVDAAVVAPPNTYLDTMGIPAVWSWQTGYTGKGIGIAIIDSGVSPDSDFRNLALSKGFNPNSSTPFDVYGHGTHIAGIVAGTGNDSNGKYKGVAPDATLIGLKISNDQGIGYESDVVKALQWVYNNKATYNIRVINLSINSGVEASYHTSPLNAAAEILWFNGVVVVVSAGNSGGQRGYNSVNAAPANDPFFITVGASDEQGTSAAGDDVMAAYSAYGRTIDGFLKPDIIAPGTAVYSVLAPLSPWGNLYPERTANNGQYFRLSGTSMAAPMVVGTVALMLEKAPNLTPDQVKYRLLDSAKSSFSMPLNGSSVNFPYVHGTAAVKSTTNKSANTGLQASQLLWTGSSPINWNSVNWNSVNWNSVNWNSVNWTSVNWTSVNWNDAVLERSTSNGIQPLAEGESWEIPAWPTELPNLEPEVDQVIDSFIFLPSLGR